MLVALEVNFALWIMIGCGIESISAKRSATLLP